MRMKTTILTAMLLLSSFTLHAQDEDKGELFDYCGELPLNTAMKVIIPAGRSKTTTQKYTLLRASKNVYDVYLNLEFRPSKNYDGALKDHHELNKFYRKKMNTCFRSVDHALVDEFGRKLRLHVYDKYTDTLPSEPPAVKIKIENQSHRSDSLAYRSDIDCPTLVHESFHLLGLVDEYEEKWLGFNHNFISLAFKPIVATSDKVLPAFDCRAVGPENSIMHNQWNMFWGKPLYSGHVNTIIYPNCAEKNDKYFTCAKYAYKTSAKNNGALPNIGDCAKKVPDFCKNESWIEVSK